MNLNQAWNLINRADLLVGETEIECTLDHLAARIGDALADRLPLVLCVMGGAVVFTGKLMPRLMFPLEFDYLHASRYRDGTRGGDIEWSALPKKEVAGRCVLLLDDILDEGDTLVGIRAHCLANGAARVLTAVLVDKNHERRHPELKRAEITGMDAPDRYLFGFGMDYKGYLRNAPGIYAVAES